MTSPDSAVDLTSLEVVRRYSLAVRQDTASRSEVLAALRADLAWLEGGARTGTRSRTAVAEPAAVAPAPAARASAAPPAKAPADPPAKAPAAKVPAGKAPAAKAPAATPSSSARKRAAGPAKKSARRG